MTPPATLECTADAAVAPRSVLDVTAAARPVTPEVAAGHQPVPPSSSLDDLAAAIRSEVQGLLQCARRGLQHAKRAGELLLRAKEQVPHGDWTAWVGSHCQFSKRSAEAYMRIADHWGEIEAEAQSVADLTLNQALKLVQKPKSDPGGHGVTQTTPPQSPSAGGEPAFALCPPATGVVSGSDAGYAPTETSSATDADTEPSWAVKLPDGEEEDLRQRLAALVDSLCQVVAAPAICGHWEAASRFALAENLLAAKTLIEQAVALLRPARNPAE